MTPVLFVDPKFKEYASSYTVNDYVSWVSLIQNVQSQKSFSFKNFLDFEMFE